MNNKYFIAEIYKGAGVGKEIEFPTINLKPVPEQLDYGVYSTEVEIDGDIYKGVMHIGPKSIGTTDNKKIFCEIHLIGFNKNIKNKQVKFKVLKKIRDVREFKSTKELKLQIKQDIRNA